MLNTIERIIDKNSLASHINHKIRSWKRHQNKDIVLKINKN